MEKYIYIIGFILIAIVLIITTYKAFEKESKNKYIGVNPVISYGNFYKEAICPKCEQKLDENYARYRAKCCYKCGFSNGNLFDVKYRLVRGKYINGMFQGSEIVKNTNSE